MGKLYRVVTTVLNCICGLGVVLCVATGKFQEVDGAMQLLIASGAYLATGYASQLEIVEVEQ